MAIPFKERVKILAGLFNNYPELKALLSLRHSGYLKDIGWFNAFNSKSSIDINNNPIPWTTYPFIQFITTRLNKNLTVFEYGSGNSTLFYADRLKNLTTVEHDKIWYEKMIKIIPNNVNLIFEKEDTSGNYYRTITKEKTKYDIIIIDAIDRVNCVKISYDFMSEQGIVILDDSEREEYAEGISFLIDKGFKSLEFWGISPGYFNNKCTSIFYRNNNCLKI
jgi:hypothetical protein